MRLHTGFYCSICIFFERIGGHGYYWDGKMEQVGVFQQMKNMQQQRKNTLKHGESPMPEITHKRSERNSEDIFHDKAMNCGLSYADND